MCPHPAGERLTRDRGPCTQRSCLWHHATGLAMKLPRPFPHQRQPKRLLKISVRPYHPSVSNTLLASYCSWGELSVLGRVEIGQLVLTFKDIDGMGFTHGHQVQSTAHHHTLTEISKIMFGHLSGHWALPR